MDNLVVYASKPSEKGLLVWASKPSADGLVIWASKPLTAGLTGLGLKTGSDGVGGCVAPSQKARGEVKQSVKALDPSNVAIKRSEVLTLVGI
jgi:hypothetical protein